MTLGQVRFKLKPVYDHWKIDFRQAKAASLHPAGNEKSGKPFVTIEYT